MVWNIFVQVLQYSVCEIIEIFAINAHIVNNINSWFINFNSYAHKAMWMIKRVGFLKVKSRYVSWFSDFLKIIIHWYEPLRSKLLVNQFKIVKRITIRRLRWITFNLLLKFPHLSDTHIVYHRRNLISSYLWIETKRFVILHHLNET